MADHNKKRGQTDDIIPFPKDRHSAHRQCPGKPAIKIIEEESVVPADSLFLADAKLKAHQSEILIADFRNQTLQTLKEAGLLRDDQVQIDSETGDCFILAENGERMGLSEYVRHVGRKRLQQESDKYTREVSEETD